MTAEGPGAVIAGATVEVPVEEEATVERIIAKGVKVKRERMRV